MNNVFIVHTPWMLLLAQLFASEYKDANNIIIFKYIDQEYDITNSKTFLKELWDEVYVVNSQEYMPRPWKDKFNYLHKLNWSISQLQKKFEFLNKRGIDCLYFFENLDPLTRILSYRVLKAKKVVYVEEGVAPYHDAYTSGYNPLNAIIKKYFVGFLGYEDIFSFQGNLEKYDKVFLLYPQKHNLSVDFNKINSLAHILNEEKLSIYSNILKDWDFPKVKHSNNVLYLPDPVRTYYVSRDDQLNFNRLIIDYLRKFDINLIIKPHHGEPKDNLLFYYELEKRYNNVFVIRDNNISIEILNLKIRATSVISNIFSSALIYLQHIYNIRAQSILPLYLSHFNYDKLNTKLEKTMRGKFQNIVDFVEREQDIYIPRTMNACSSNKICEDI